MVVQSPKPNTLADGLIERTSSMLDEIAPKAVHKDEKKVSNRAKRSKSLNEVKPVEKKNKNWQSFLEISLVQNNVPPSHKL